jgi:serine protease AprX
MKTLSRISICFIVLTALSVIALAGTNDRCWVYLREPQLTPSQLHLALQQAKSTLTQRCLTKRAKVRASTELVDEFDLPLNQSILDSITAHGFEIVVKSKMLRAVSVIGSYNQVRVLQGLPFIKSVEPLPVKMSETFHETISPNALPLLPRRATTTVKPRTPTIQEWDSIDYGYSYRQLEILHVVEAHRQGYTGQGVLLGMNDAGFPRLCRSYSPNDTNSYHVVFDSLHIVATHDFLHGDSLVNETTNSTHGTNTLSCIAGYKDSLYIGAAPNVWVTLAETEQAPGADFPAEEDYWVAGLEWHENYGADIVSSSLSWVAWYPDSTRDGHHSPASRASTLAAARGTLVVNSAGNHGPNGHMSPPSDADSMICVGSVDFSLNYSIFASHGPSYDGRIKPDLMAVGDNTAVADASSPTRITSASGTSFSAPTIAGACAVVLSANHDLTPLQLIHVMKRSADRWDNPDTLYGWGIPNVAVAVDSALNLSSVTHPDVANRVIPEQYIIRAFPNPFNPSIVLYFAPTAMKRQIGVYDILGRMVDNISVSAGSGKANFMAKSLPSGNYYLKFEHGQATQVTLVR